MNHIISNVKKSLSKAVSAVQGKFSEVKNNISGMKKVRKRRVFRTHNVTTRQDGMVFMQHATQHKRRSAPKKVNTKRFTAVVAIAIAAIMVPVMVMAANGDTAAPSVDPAEVTPVEQKAAPSAEATPETQPVEQTTQVSEGDATLTAESVPQEAVVAEATPTPEPTPQYVTLTAGVNDPTVASMQERLMELHYMSEDQPTDYFGPATLKAVQAFQRKNGIAVDGAAGAETQAILFSEGAKEYTAALGAEGEDVGDIQDRLAELGYNVSSTGYFGEDTEKAVKYFQRMNGLTDDGSVGSMTKDVLFSDNAEKSEELVKQEEAAKKKEESSNKGNSSSSGSSSNKGNSSSSGSSSNKGNSSSSGSSGSSGGSAPAADPGNVEAFIDAAMSQVGKPYVLGGKGPDTFDCSGFVYYALNASGNGVGYMTSGGWAGSGYASVGWDELQRGDIVCVSGHVGIYLGGGQIVDASSGSGQIVVRNMGSWFQSRFICGKRVL